MLVLFEVGQLDLVIADWVYAFEGQAWQYKKSFFFNTVMHDWVRIGFNMFAVSLLLKLSYDCFFSNIRQRGATLYLSLCIISTTATVAILKKMTHVGCPWHYTRYGGDYTYTPIFNALAPSETDLVCFPAGHASGGYALIALYFYCLLVSPEYRWLGLSFGLLFGFSLDLAQQFRGAHFASHGLWTLLFAWTIAHGLYVIYQMNFTKILIRAH